jgi:hypothetical protein
MRMRCGGIDCIHPFFLIRFNFRCLGLISTDQSIPFILTDFAELCLIMSLIIDTIMNPIINLIIRPIMSQYHSCQGSKLMPCGMFISSITCDLFSLLYRGDLLILYYIPN